MHMTEAEFARLTRGKPAKRRKPHQMGGKYGNKVVERAGERFDSKKEYRRWCDLQMMEKGNEIAGLRRQVPFELRVNGMLVCKYVSDFVYIDENGETVVEDVKGVITREFSIKQKLMRALHGIDVKVVK